MFLIVSSASLVMGEAQFQLSRSQFAPTDDRQAAVPFSQQSPLSGAPLVGPLLAATPASQDRIIIYDLGSETRRELSFGAGQLFVWDFSPDSCRVAFTLSDGSTPAHLYSARLDGSDLREMVQYTDMPPDAWGIWEPQWSPDGSRIAFTMTRDTSYLESIGREAQDDTYEYRVAWIPAEGGAPQFYSRAGDEHTPQWSPDGSWLTYVAYEARVPGADPSSTAVPTPLPPPGQAPPPAPLIREADLWVISADGEERYRLTYFDTGSVSDPRWSPDGELISFVYSPTGNNDQFWMIANHPGAIPTQLSAQLALIMDVTWLPDSSAMLSAVRDFHDEPSNRLWRIPLVGNADSDATLYGDDSALTYADYPRFSADGRWLALRSEYSLTVMDTTTNTWRILDADALGDTPPVWSRVGFTGEQNC
jgi:Tol biopolymer transport system component